LFSILKRTFRLDSPRAAAHGAGFVSSRAQGRPPSAQAAR
jgi:hypothetical protein